MLNSKKSEDGGRESLKSNLNEKDVCETRNKSCSRVITRWNILVSGWWTGLYFMFPVNVHSLHYLKGLSAKLMNVL